MILLFLAAQAATAVPYRPAPSTIVAEPVAILFAGFDRDGDARTTLAECRQGVADFARANPAWGAPMGYIAFADWADRYLGDRNAIPTPFDVDRDGDNKVTPDELADRIEALFTRFDRDKDGVLTRAELLTIRNDARRDRPGRRDLIPDGPPPRR